MQMLVLVVHHVYAMAMCAGGSSQLVSERVRVLIHLHTCSVSLIITLTHGQT